MNVSFDFNFWTALLFALNFGLAIFVSLSNRRKAEHDELKSMEARLATDIKSSKEAISSKIEVHSERLSRIESDIDNAIGDDDMKAIHRRVDEILSFTKSMEGKLELMSQSFDQIQRFMLNGGKNG